MYGRVVLCNEGEAHSYCRVMEAGDVPECPLADDITPKPCTNLCIQMQECTGKTGCSCHCENLLCQIGQSVRSMRSKGLISRKGYVPLELRWQTLRDIQSGKLQIAVDPVGKVDWKKVYEYLCGLSSHGAYTLESVAERLAESGLPIKKLPNEAGLAVANRIIAVDVPDFGKPGIWSLELAYRLYEVASGKQFISEFSGRGRQYDEVLEKFRQFIEENKRET